MKFHSRATLSSLLALTLLLAGCKAPDLRPSFLRKPQPAPAPATTVDLSLTPRELLTARLINSRAADDAMPGMTIGKLIEYADRYLTCDCADTRFAKAWQRIDGGYELTTNAAQVRPLEFRCTGPAENLECFLREIDRGANLTDLRQRFMPGSDFIHFIYDHGSRCERTTPCPGAGAR